MGVVASTGGVLPSRPGLNYWVMGTFISALLIALVVVPLIINHQMAAILAEANQRADPADKYNGAIQAGLSHEVSGILGFQVAGDRKYVDLYNREKESIERALTSLRQLSPPLGPHVEARLSDLEAAVANWHQDVEENRFLEVRLPPSAFLDRLFGREYMVEAAHQASTHFNETISAWRAEQRTRVGDLAQLFTFLSVGAAVLTLIAITLIVQILRRIISATTYLEDRARQEEGLRNVASALTGILTLDDVLRTITETASQTAEAESVYIELVDVGKDEFTCVAGHGSGVPATGTKGRYSGSLAEEILSEGEPRIITDVSVERERRSVFGDLARSCGSCAAMTVPLIAEQQRLGALFLIRRHPRDFSDTEIPRVKVLADLAAVGIQRALTLEELRKIQAEEHFLSEAAMILASSLDYRTTLKAIVRLAVPRIADWSAIHLVENGEIRTVEIAHSDPSKLSMARRLQEQYPAQPELDVGVVRVIRTGQAEHYPEITEEFMRRIAKDNDHLALLHGLRLKSAMILPLGTGDETFGAMTFVSQRKYRYGPDDVAFGEAIARHVSMAIQNARLYASAQEAIRARDEVLRVVSHDLRNPVSNIQMTAKLLAAESLTESTRSSLLQVIGRATERMNRLIEDLIAVARLRGRQRINLEIQAVNPSEIVEEACETFTAQSQSKSIRLRCDKPRLVPMVKADKYRILQVLSNLLDNAMKFTPEGGRITVGCEVHGDLVLFTVRDTGRGIEPEHLTKIFDLFWQAKPTAHMGAGFGLAIAKAIIEQHGGRIWAESKPGVGATFFFTLPQASDGVLDQEAAG
jgi:K+-sensing histidine kinase KdpD